MNPRCGEPWSWDRFLVWANSPPVAWHWTLAILGAFAGLVFFGLVVSEGEGMGLIFAARRWRVLILAPLR